MMQPQEVIGLIQEALPDAQVMIEDRTGQQDHYIVKVAASAFKEKGLMDRHRLVYDSVQPALDDGRLHAIEIKTIVMPD